MAVAGGHVQAVQYVHAGMATEAWRAAATGEGRHCYGGWDGEGIKVVGLPQAQDQQAHQGGATEGDKDSMNLRQNRKAHYMGKDGGHRGFESRSFHKKQYAPAG